MTDEINAMPEIFSPSSQDSEQKIDNFLKYFEFQRIRLSGIRSYFNIKEQIIIHYQSAKNDFFLSDELDN